MADLCLARPSSPDRVPVTHSQVAQSLIGIIRDKLLN